MNSRAAVLALLVVTHACAVSRSSARAVAADLAITNVNVVDVQNGRLEPDQTLLISGNRISEVGPAVRVSLPPGVPVVNAKGRYLIPGLWDMHTHALDEDRSGVFLPLFVANGVTGLRDMHSRVAWPRLRQLKNEISEGRRVGPRLKAAGPQIDRRDAPSPEAGRTTVNARADGGADFIKVSSFLSRDVYLAVADQARQRQVPLVGHVPFSVGVREAADAGQQSMEHLFGILLACSGKENELRQEALAALADPTPPPELHSRLFFALQTRALLQTHDPRKCAGLFEQFRTRGTWQVPTLIVLKTGACQDATARRDPRLRYMPSRIQTAWQRTCAGRVKAYTAEDRASRKRQFQKELQLVQALQRAGVDILAGSDVPNAYVFPGFSLHDELQLLVQAGLTPAQALRTATLNPARYLGMTDELGTVEPGKLADLVLLEADPLRDIRNTQRISAVVINGRFLNRSALDRILSQVQADAGRQ